MQDTGQGCCRKGHLGRAAFVGRVLQALFSGFLQRTAQGAESLGRRHCLHKVSVVARGLQIPWTWSPRWLAHPPRARRMEGALSDSIPQGVVGAPQAPLAQGSASSSSAWGGEVASSLSLLSGDRDSLAPVHIKCCLGLGTSLKTHFKSLLSLHLPQVCPPCTPLTCTPAAINRE